MSEGLFSNLFGCFCRAPPNPGQSYTNSVPPELEPEKPVSDAEFEDVEDFHERRVGSMRLQPSFSSAQRTANSSKPNPQGRNKSSENQIDYFVEMEPTYKPPNTVVIPETRKTGPAPKKNSFGFEVSEVEMEFGMSNIGWDDVDDEIAPPVSTKVQKGFASKKSKDSFEW